MSWLLCLLVFLQDPNTTIEQNTTLPTGHAIAEGASRAFSDLEAKADALEQRLTAEQKKVQELEGENAALRAQLRERDAEKEPTPAAKITQVSTTNCKACVDSTAFHQPRYESSKWLWASRTERMRPGKRYPYWEVCIGDTCEVLQLDSWHNLDAAVSGLMATRKWKQ